MHKRLQNDGRKNFMGLQLPVQSKLNYDKFFQYLSPTYRDWQLPFLVKFGFPLDVMENCVLQSDLINHASAKNSQRILKKYLQEEKNHGAILGPYETPPCQLHTSSFLSRERNEFERRVIVDLSWPKGSSVNDATISDQYLGVNFQLTLPTIDHVTRAVTKFGKNSYIAKIDISRALKHVPIDPKDINHLGLHWDGYYIEKKT